MKAKKKKKLKKQPVQCGACPHFPLETTSCRMCRYAGCDTDRDAACLYPVMYMPGD